MAVTLTVLNATWLKLSTADSSTLQSNQKYPLCIGATYPIAACADQDDHWKITFGVGIDGKQISFIGRNTWYVYKRHVRIDGLPSAVPNTAPNTVRSINDSGLNLLKSFEGCKLTAYVDCVGVLTIGYGCTTNVTPGMCITQAEAEDRLKRDLQKFEVAVSELVTVPLNNNQFSALVSFTYNVGDGALEDSSLLRILNYGDYYGAANQFMRWDSDGNGGHLPGLTRRRKAEEALFLSQDYSRFI